MRTFELSVIALISLLLLGMGVAFIYVSENQHQIEKAEISKIVIAEKEKFKTYGDVAISGNIPLHISGELEVGGKNGGTLVFYGLNDSISSTRGNLRFLSNWSWGSSYANISGTGLTLGKGSINQTYVAEIVFTYANGTASSHRMYVNDSGWLIQE